MDELDAYLDSELRNPDFRAWYQHFSSRRRCLTCKVWSALPLIGKPIFRAHSRTIKGRVTPKPRRDHAPAETSHAETADS